MSATELSGADRVELRRAKSLLERRGLAVRVADAIGTPVEKLLGTLPENAVQVIHAATAKSLNAALRAVVSQMNDAPRPPTQWMHTVAVATTGAVGGAFGLATLAVELPVSTIIMLRSIADVARSEGQSIRDTDVQLACLEVFALGGPSRGDDAAESAYFAVRAGLAQTLKEAARHIAQRGLTGEAAPAILRLTTQVAARFGIPVTEKVMAQSVPVLGAAGGALINVLFIKHFQDLARGHFIVRRLEARYGQAAVREAYMRIEAGGQG